MQKGALVRNAVKLESIPTASANQSLIASRREWNGEKV